MASLQQAQDQLSLAYLSFNDAVEPELVDASIYEIRAIQARSSYLLRKMKDIHAAEGQPWT